MAIDVGNLVLASATISVDEADCGATVGGVYMRSEDTFRDVEIDQFIGTWKKVLTGRKYFVRANLAEGTLLNLRKAWNLAEANLSGSTLTLDETDRGSVAVTLAGTGPDGSGRTVTLATCVALAATEYPVGRKDEESVFAIELEVLADSSNDFGTIVDAAA